MGERLNGDNGNDLWKSRGFESNKELASARVDLLHNPVFTICVWFPISESSNLLGRILASANSRICNEWEFFLKMHLDRQSETEVYVVCYGESQAYALGLAEDWDFSLNPILHISNWEEENELSIRLVITDDIGDRTPLEICMNSIRMISAVLLTEFSDVSETGKPLDGFCKAILPELRSYFEETL